jgi:hypothetical protein
VYAAKIVWSSPQAVLFFLLTSCRTTPAPPPTRWKDNGENLHRFGEEFEHKT